MTTTKRFRQRRACAVKQEFGRATAEKVAAQMNRRGLRQPVNAYRCPVCKGWHVGRIDRHGRGD